MENTMKKNILKNEKKISRQNFLKGGAGIIAGAMTLPLMAQDHSGHENMHHEHMKLSAVNVAIANAAADCVTKSELCLSHCIMLVKMKDTSLAECMEKVAQTIAVCQGLGAMASYNSEHLKKYAMACVDVCKSCQKECEKHAKKHEECKDCAESCKKCIDACSKLAA